MTTALIGFAALLALCFMGFRVGFATLTVGFVGFGLERGFHASLGMVGQQVLEDAMNYNLSVTPLFILMGVFVYRSDVSRDSYDAAYAALGRFKGGLALATVLACGTIAEQDIRLLFMAGILLGLLLVLLFMLAVVVVVYRDPSAAPPSEELEPARRKQAIRGTLHVLILFLVVLGGIYGGVFTATEASGIGAFGAAAIGLSRGYLRKLSQWRECLSGQICPARGQTQQYLSRRDTLSGGPCPRPRTGVHDAINRNFPSRPDEVTP